MQGLLLHSMNDLMYSQHSPQQEILQNASQGKTCLTEDDIFLVGIT